MAIFKCKMCGGDLNVTEGASVCECEYCGTQQTVPTADNEKKINAFNRANHLRSICEFDKAAGVYESIVTEFPEEAEAYWGLCLCKFGIEYADDPATGKKIPTCHRTSYESIFEDGNFEQALEWADSVAHQVYRAEAKEIDRLQKEILDIAKNEQPFDVFICYKESDENGQRTVDSELAHDIYDVLTEKGYKVFYARITLKAKLGQDYEPYIFSALNSAKVMLAVGTRYEYYSAVWVKNEWSRYLALMSKDGGKTLIPCYRDIDAYDMPKEFKHLQGQDLSSPRAFQDLVSNIEKIIPRGNVQPSAAVQQPVIVSGSSNVEPLLKRAFMCLEDAEWQKADELFEQALNHEPENARAYLGKLCVEMRLCKPSDIADLKEPLDEGNSNYKKAMRFADAQLKNEIDGYSKAILDRIENERKESIYSDGVKKFKSKSYEEAKRVFLFIRGYKDSQEMAEKCDYNINNVIYNKAYAKMNSAKTAEECTEAKKVFGSIHNFRDSAEMMKKCDEKKKLLVYNEAVYAMTYAQKESAFKRAEQMFVSICGFKDSEELAKQCAEKAEKAHTDELERARQEKEAQMKQKYDSAVEDMRRDTIVMLECAAKKFKEIPNYMDSVQLIEKCEKRLAELQEIERRESIRAAKARRRRNIILGIASAGMFTAAAAIILVNTVFIPRSKYNKAMTYYHNEDYVNAASVFAELDNYKDSREWYKTSVTINTYNQAVEYEQQEDYSSAINLFAELGDFRDAREKYSEILRTMYLKNHTTSTIAAIDNYTFGVSSNGNIIYLQEDSNNIYRKWVTGLTELEDIISISAAGATIGNAHVVGLKKDGTVVAVGSKNFGACDVGDWSDIVAISAGVNRTVGLKSDGSVISTKYDNHGKGIVRMERWEEDALSRLGEVASITAVNEDEMILVLSNGDTMKITLEFNYFVEEEYIEGWTDIIAVSASAGGNDIVGLKADGTVLYTGTNNNPRDVSGWTDIVAVSVSNYHTVGLKADGTVVAVGGNKYGQCDVSEWTDIVSIAASDYHTIGLKSDGTVVATGRNNNNQCDVSDWKDIAMPTLIS